MVVIQVITLNNTSDCNVIKYNIANFGPECDIDHYLDKMHIRMANYYVKSFICGKHLCRFYIKLS